jgi:hypothetical protein
MNFRGRLRRWRVRTALRLFQPALPRLRQANRLFEQVGDAITAADFSTIDESDIRTSRVFSGGLDSEKLKSS